jgi:hypothetical protein
VPHNRQSATNILLFYDIGISKRDVKIKISGLFPQHQQNARFFSSLTWIFTPLAEIVTRRLHMSKKVHFRQFRSVSAKAFNAAPSINKFNAQVRKEKPS